MPVLGEAATTTNRLLGLGMNYDIIIITATKGLPSAKEVPHGVNIRVVLKRSNQQNTTYPKTMRALPMMKASLSRNY